MRISNRSSVFAGMLISASLAPFSKVYAANWCPTSTDYTITCSNCTMTLTCDYSGGIRITGSNVYLDGNGKTLSSSTSHGIEVTGNGSYIANVSVLWADAHGIYYNNTGGYSSVYNVYVYGSENDGLRTFYRSQKVNISYSQFVENHDVGVNTADSPDSGNYTDVNNSYIIHNWNDGLISFGMINQWHSYNDYSDNNSEGALESNGDDGFYKNSTFNSNGWNGLVLDQLPGTNPIQIHDNQGSGNGINDCSANSVLGLDVNNNSWGANNGCVDI